ncbi:DNA/RNA non-specific endonuclease [Roseibium sediminicola]|uniref:DNA/RNA non-specific endonuclease n=1 Tax=Roseibium sediminicola TaxID=2933272 RepID=A0ABT0GRE7_9HYPH|nr:DNA/RNA non-specific endonuclease [Roseibium sp. CAU 1639]MCK7611999.1 DNA/RNA non-specific endonuclease [Roseibium sp. CAU 1639]
MNKCNFLYFLVALLLCGNHQATAQTTTTGETVVLVGGTARGVPLHRDARQSRFGYADPGTFAEIVDKNEDGNWFLVKLDSAQAWVLSRYTKPSAAIQPTSPPSIDYSRLLEADCSGSNKRLLSNSLFAICQDVEWRVPVWVAYLMRGDELDGPGERHRSSWETDNRLTLSGQANDRVYAGSDFHKGHLAPAQAYVRTQAAVDGTHIYTNAVPQFGSINSGAWSKLEAAVRVMAKSGADLWIVTGSLFVPIDPRCQKNRPPLRCLTVDTSGRPDSPSNKMRGKIAVPSHTFKAILSQSDGQWSARAFIMPNIPRGAGQFRNYRFSVDTLEEMLGIDLFSTLPDDIENKIEERATQLTR